MKRTGRWGELCALIVAGLAALSLWSWGAGVGHLFAFTPGHVPMAPLTALCLGLMGVALILRRNAPKRSGSDRLGQGATAVVALVATFALVRPWVGWGSPVEEWLSQTSDRIGDIPVGQMSPFTGALLLAVAVAYWLQSASARSPSVPARMATLVALIVFGTGAGAVISYALGRPWFYGGSFIPMALWTSFAFVFLGLALLCHAAQLKSPSADESALPDNLAVGPNPASTLVAVALAVAISAITALYLRHGQSQDRRDANRLLDAVASLKLAQILDWRQERLNDARFFMQAEFVAHDVQAFLSNAAAERTRNRLVRWLNLLKGGERYSLVALFDTNEVVRLSLPKDTNLVASLAHLVSDVTRTNELSLSDLNRDPVSGDVHLDLIFPVFGDSGNPTNAAGPPPILFGRVLVRINPQQFLFPLLQSWPTPSRTAETVLFRREANEVVFLNPLRHRTNSPMSLRFPIEANSRLPAVRAILDQPGAIEGRDYRGVPVLADIRAVPDTSWFLVTKMDQDEIYASLREQAWLTLALTAVLALATGLLVGLLSKRGEAIRALRDLATERKQRELAQRVEHLMKHASDAIMLADAEDRIVEANERLLQTYGYSLAELQGMQLIELRAPQARASFAAKSAEVLAAGQAVFETLHRRKDGSVFPVEISSNVIELDGRRFRLGILRDITERKAHEREIERMNRLYATLSEMNQGIVRVQSREQLFQDVCRIAVEVGGFKLAWLGWINPTTQQVLPIARAGDDSGYIDKIRVFADDRPEGQGLVGTCVRTGKTSLSNDVINDPRTAPWHEVAEAHGLRGAVALPIRMHGEICGVFIVYASEPGMFQDREVALLEEMAVDISYALDQLQYKELHQQAEQALRESEELYRTLIGASPNAVTVTDLAGRTVFASAKAREMFGEDPAADLTGRTVLDWVAPEDRERAQENVRRLVADGQFLETEYTMLRKDGTRFSAEVTVGVFRASDGAPKGKIVVTRDITERKQREQREHLHLRTLELLASGAALPVVLEAIVTLLECGHADWRCAIMLVDETGRRLVHGAAPQLPEFYQEAVEGLAIGPGVGSCGTAAATKQLVVVEDVLTHPYWEGFRDLARRTGFRACWSQPILSAGEKVLGTFAIYHAEPHAPTRDEVHALAGVTGLASIAIEQRRTEKAIRESEGRLKLALAASRMGVWEWDLQTNAILWSPECYEIVGLRPQAEPFTIEHFTNLVHPDDRAQVLAAARLAIANRTVFNAEFRVIRPDGALRWLADDARASYDAQGKPLRLVGTVQDITNRKLAEAQVRKLSRAVEQSPNSIVITNPAGEIEYVNPKFTQVTGYTLAEIRGQNPRVLKSGETLPGTYERLWDVITHGGEWVGELHNKKKNGELFWELAHISPVLDEAGRITNFIAVKEDITERKRLEIQLRQAQKMEAVGQLAGGVAHDFNNILSAIMMHLGLLRDVPNLDPFLVGSLKELESEAQRAANLTRQLLLFGRRSVMQVKALDVNEVVENLLKMLRRLIGEQVNLEWQGRSQLPAVSGDTGMLEQVVMNLVVNARDAMPNGGRIIITTELVELDESRAREHPDARPGRFVSLSVRDHGGGMEEATLKRIFEPFFTTKEAGRGTGLGLATVYGIAAQHQGWVTVESEVGRGSTFRVFLPALARSLATADPRPAAPPPSGGRETILLVEDEPSVRKTVSSFLRLCGYHIIEATNGLEALGLWALHWKQINLLFTDMVMPGGINGLRLAEKLRAAKPELKVLIASGYSADLVQQHDLAGKGILFLAKPCAANALAAAIRQCLDKPLV